MARYYGYNAIFGTQSRVNGVVQDYAYQPTVGASWSYSGDQQWFHVREARNNDTDYNGDGGSGTSTNETIASNLRFGGNREQLAYVNGHYYQTIWDYTFAVTDGAGHTYRVGVIDIDFNSNNLIDATGSENGYYLVFPDGVPPAGTYTVTSYFDNGASSPHSTLGGHVVCFADGTLIDTPEGPRPVQALRPGDLVTTQDHGAQPLRWVGRRLVRAQGNLAPIRFETGALGNARPLMVSPQHRMLVTGWRAELYFGEPSVLIRAKDLVNGTTIARAEGGTVAYNHLLFERHEIVYSEGIPSESLQPGEATLGSVTRSAAAELLELFPDMPTNPDVVGPAARPSLKGYEAACLAA